MWQKTTWLWLHMILSHATSKHLTHDKLLDLFEGNRHPFTRFLYHISERSKISQGTSEIRITFRVWGIQAKSTRDSIILGTYIMMDGAFVCTN